MERDVRFEIQYLLSLTLVVFGILSIKPFRMSINPGVGYLLIFLLSIHFSIFNIFYGFGSAISFSIDFVEEIERASWPVLSIIAITFVYFISHAFLSLIYEYITHRTGFTSTEGQMIMKYAVPGFLIAFIVMVFREHVAGPFDEFGDINIKIVPDFIRVFSVKEDTRPLSVKVENNGDSNFKYTLVIDVPTDVILYFEGEENRDTFTKEGSVGPGHADRRSFELKHESGDRANDVITVSIDFEGGSQTKEVELELVA